MKKILFALAIALMLSGCAQQSQQQPSEGQTQPQTQNINIKLLNKDSEILYEKQIKAGMDETLFEAMRENSFPFEYKQYSFGAMVTGIAGQYAPDGEYIAIYKDGRYSNEGMSSLRLTKDTNIEFRFEGVKLPS